MNGLCGSKSPGSGRPAVWASSAYEPITVRWSSRASQIHTGSGVPQYRSREIAQSMLFTSHSPNRPDPISGGFQFTAALRAIISSLNAVVRTNQLVRA